MKDEEVIEKLQLIKSPTEGGYYKETFRAKGEAANDIYYLLTRDKVCALHKVKRP